MKSCVMLLAWMFSLANAGAADLVEAGKPRKEIPELLSRIVEASRKESENDRLFHRGYRYERCKIEEEKNSKGEVTERTVRKSTNDPTVMTVKKASRKQAGKDDSQKLGKGKAVQKREEFINEELLARFRYEWVGEESHAGRPAFVMDFKPQENPKKESEIKDKFLNRLAGRMWVDTNDCVVVRVDVRLLEEVDIAGGIIAKIRNFTYSFFRERTAEGLWFTRKVDWKLVGRQLLGNKIMEYHEYRTNEVKIDMSM